MRKENIPVGNCRNKIIVYFLWLMDCYFIFFFNSVMSEKAKNNVREKETKKKN